LLKLLVSPGQRGRSLDRLMLRYSTSLVTMSNNANKKELTEDEKHFHHVLGGYKATLSNSSSSEEARKHAEEMIEFLSESKDFPAESADRQKYSEEEKHLHQVLGGYKATLSNSKSSEEAKKNAQEMLDTFSYQAREHRKSSGSAEKKEPSQEEIHRHRVEGGYKATLNNAKTSDDAKIHAQKMLDLISKGEELPESEKTRGLTEEEKHRHHVEGGYKATLNNVNASDEAKLHAQQMLQKMANGEDVPASSGLSYNDASDTRVAAGYKATLSNANSSEEAKKHAQEMLDKAGVDANERLADSKKDLTEDEKHRHHVEGGYKATLSNENASEEAKKHAQEMLDKLAKGEELPESEKRGQKRTSDDVASEDKESAKGKQGFAAMPKEKVQEIASLGGRTAHAGEEPAPKKAAQ